MARPKLGILVGPRGRGSNMQAIARACLDGRIAADVATVVAPKLDAPAVSVAQDLGIRTQIIAPGDDYGVRLLHALENCALVCLAGYLRLLPGEVLRAFPGRVINIHPALLPKFGGKGMYGLHVHEAVLAAGETESGCTVHLVTEVYDEGTILIQKRCPVVAGDTAETLAARVLKLEHEAYPEAISLVLGHS